MTSKPLKRLATRKRAPMRTRKAKKFDAEADRIAELVEMGEVELNYYLGAGCQGVE